jgi:hypothetical protein
VLEDAQVADVIKNKMVTILCRCFILLLCRYFIPIGSRNDLLGARELVQKDGIDNGRGLDSCLFLAAPTSPALWIKLLTREERDKVSQS